MRHFELFFNEEIEIYLNSGLTPTELFIVRLLFLAIDDKPEYLIKYLRGINNGKELLKNILESLKNKKVINSTFNIPKEGETLNFKNIPFNKNFLKMYIRESNEVGKEFFDAYPSFININGKLVSIKNFTKAGLYSFEEFCVYYAKQIKSANITHQQIMETVEFAKENNIIHYSILEFLASRKWEEIEYIRNSGNVNGYNNTELL